MSVLQNRKIADKSGRAELLQALENPVYNKVRGMLGCRGWECIRELEPGQPSLRHIQMRLFAGTKAIIATVPGLESVFSNLQCLLDIITD